MPIRIVLQSPTLVACLLVGCWCLGASLCVAAGLLDPQPRLLHPAVLASAGLTVGWMLLGWCLMLVRFPATGLLRLIWTLGVSMLLLHLVLAFGLAHAWSHEAAVEHVREVGGFGGGILVSYAFAAIWFADVAWWWVSPTTHASRPRWVGSALHGFLAFVVLNATVVFGAPERRPWYCGAIVILVVLWVWRKNERLRSA